MILYIPNKYVDVLDALLRRNERLDLEVGEMSIFLQMQIRHEKAKTPYTLWLRDQKNGKANRKHSPGTKEYVTRGSTGKDSRDSPEQVHSKARRRSREKKGNKEQGY